MLHRFLAMLTLLICTTGAFAQTNTSWKGAPGVESDWSTWSNWTNGEPNNRTNNNAFINNGGIASVSALGELSYNTSLGSFSGMSGSIHIVSGSLTIANTINIGASGTGAVTQDGGVLSAVAALVGAINLGGSMGSYTLNDGNVNATKLNLNSGGSFTQNGGRVTVGMAPSYFNIYDGGTYTLNGGTLNFGSSSVSFQGTFIFNGGSLNGIPKVATFYVGKDAVGNVTSYSGFSATTAYVGYNSTGALNMQGSGYSWNVYLGYNAGDSGTFRCVGGTESDGNAYVGYSGTGVFATTGGTHTIRTALYLGYNAGGSGTYNLSGGTISNSGAPVYVGYSGTGAFNQSNNSSFTCGQNLYVGYNNGANGTYSLNTATLTNAYTEYIGYDGNGIFNQTKGTHQPTNLILGFNADGDGNYVMTSGILKNSNTCIGYGGTADFIHTDGNHVNTGNITIGALAGASGSYEFNAGLVNEANMYIGAGGTGAFTQTGGKHLPTNAVYLGYGAGSSGTYNLNGGFFDGNNLHIGYGGTGAFVQTDGNHINTGSIFLGDLTGSSGSYTLSHGTLQDGNIYVGSTGSASFVQADGNHTVTTSLNVGPLGSYDLQGGVLRVGSLFNQASSLISGSFRQEAGTYVFYSGSYSLIIDSNKTTAATYHLMDGNLILSGYPNFVIGNAGKGTFLQEGGQVDSNRPTYIGMASGSLGEYDLSRGSLNISVPSTSDVSHGLVIGYDGNGIFHQTGGTVNANAYILIGYNNGNTSHIDSTGTYLLDGGIVNVTGMAEINMPPYAGLYQRSIAIWGGGQFIQNGGTVNSLRIATSGGSYTLNGGTLNTSNFGGSGTVVFNAGTLAYQPDWNIATINGTNPQNLTFMCGSLYLAKEQGTSFSFSFGNDPNDSMRVYSGCFIGDKGAGSLTQNGSVFEESNVYLGYSASGQGVYTMTGGVCRPLFGAPTSVGATYVGYGGQGTLNQVIGDSLVGVVYLGYQAGSNGLYEQTDGNLAVTYRAGYHTYYPSFAWIPPDFGTYVGVDGNGTFIQSGGTHATSGLKIGSHGVYDMRGGNLAVHYYIDPNSDPNFYAGTGAFTNTGRFTQSGGAVAADRLTNAVGGAYELRGGSVSVHYFCDANSDPNFFANNGTLLNSGLFTQSGGGVAADRLTVNQGGVYSMSGGAMTAGTVVVGDSGGGQWSIAAEANVTISTLLSIGPGGSILAAQGSVIQMTGSEFQNHSTDANALAGLAAVTMIFEGGAAAVDPFEVAGRDLGTDANGYNVNFMLGTLEIGSLFDVGQVRLVDNFDNQPDWLGPEALYVDCLILTAGSSLDLNGVNLYYRTAEIDPAATITGGAAIQVVPEPATLALLAMGGLALLRRKSGRP